MKKPSLRAPRRGTRVSQITRGSATTVLIILQYLATVARADVTDQELKNWFDNSTVIFRGTIITMSSNVGAVNSSDSPMTVKVENVERGSDAVAKSLGSLIGKQITVIVDPSFIGGPERKPGVSAIFFINPRLYAEHIAVTAVALANNQTVGNLPKRLSAIVKQDKTKALKDTLKSADKVVLGRVTAVRPLPDEKHTKLQSLANGRDLYSEHSPKWMEAIIHGRLALKGDLAEQTMMIVFPNTDDRMWDESPKFKTNQLGIFLLHTDQLAEDRAQILLTPEQLHGQPIKAYTALSPQDFQPRKNEKLIRDILRNTNPQ